MVEDTQDAARRLREQDAKPDADVPAYCYPNAKPLADTDWYFDTHTHHHPYGHRLTDAYGFANAHRVPDTYVNGIRYAFAQPHRLPGAYPSTLLQWWRLLGQPTRRQL